MAARVDRDAALVLLAGQPCRADLEPDVRGEVVRRLICAAARCSRAIACRRERAAVEERPVQDEGGRAGVGLGGQEPRVLVEVGDQEADLRPRLGPLDVGLGLLERGLLGERGQLGAVPHGAVDQGLDLGLVGVRSVPASCTSMASVGGSPRGAGAARGASSSSGTTVSIGRQR